MTKYAGCRPSAAISLTLHVKTKSAPATAHEKQSFSEKFGNLPKYWAAFIQIPTSVRRYSSTLGGLETVLCGHIHHDRPTDVNIVEPSPIVTSAGSSETSDGTIRTLKPLPKNTHRNSFATTRQGWLNALQYSTETEGWILDSLTRHSNWSLRFRSL